MALVVVGLFFAFAFLAAPVVVAASGVTATGGGIVKEGQDLVLKYDVGKEWTSCYWYRFDTKDKYEYCIFTSNPDTSAVTKTKCSPNAASGYMTYNGTDKKECTIMIPKVSFEDSKTWAVRVDDQMNTVSVEVAVAKQVESNNVEVPPLQAGSKGTITCKVVGGSPAPNVTYAFEPSRDGLVNSSSNVSVKTGGKFTTDLKIFVQPDVSDDGRNVSCKAVILDGDKMPLFEPFQSDIAQLKVLFPPQEAENQTIAGKMGKNAKVSFHIMANPMPSAVTWTVLAATKVPVKSEGNETTKYNITYNPVTIVPGQSTDKYAASKLTAEEGRNKYNATFEIRNVEEADVFSQYKLEVRSSTGMQTYFFKVSLGGIDGSNGTNWSSSGKITTAQAWGIGLGVAALVIVIVIIGALAMRKSNARRGETVPLAR